MSKRKRQTMIHKTLHRKRSLKTSLITLLIILSYASDAYCHSYRSIHLAARMVISIFVVTFLSGYIHKVT
jgi:hypothetical protein